MRNAFASEVTKMATDDGRIILLSGDIGNRLFDELRTQRPRQFLNCGVAEQNMMGVAAGMALCGLRPIVYTIAPFTTVRCLEQIKIDVAYHDAPVIIVGTGSGLSYASLGPTHHSLEDFAVLRAIPNLQVLAPWDAESLRTCLRLAHASDKPTYIRIGKKGEPDLSDGRPIPSMGQGFTLQSGKQLCILAVGSVAHEADSVARMLKDRGLDVEIVFTYTVKPSPLVLFDSLLNRFECFVVVEEHSSLGGFGESFLSHLARRGFQKKVVCLGTSDAFLSTAGSQASARTHYGIDAISILKSVNAILADYQC